jgi:Uma2 family endonuclease
MIVATDRRLSLDDYLNYDDGTDARYELVNGVLVSMGAESTANNWIAAFLYAAFLRSGLPYNRVGMKQKIEVQSVDVSAREPDLIVHSDASTQALAGRSEVCLRLTDPNPLLVIEVVSNSDIDRKSKTRDYIEKRAEYETRGIPEYWIIDPIGKLVLVLNLVDDAYQVMVFIDAQPIVSQSFPELGLTANEIFAAGN